MAIKIHGAKPAPAQTSNGDVDLGGIGGGSPHTSQEPAHGPDSGASPATTPNPPQSGPAGQVAAPGHQSGASFLMTGDQQKNQVNQVKAVQDLRTKLRGGAREFWLEPGQFAKLYFLDGKLLSDNVFDTPMINTHMLQIGGSWAKFVCNTHTEGTCVVCASNAEGSQPMTMQLFTVINVMPYTIQNGPRRGQILPARLQLFASTVKTREKMIKRAQNHGNALAGSLYHFSRASKQDARTGDDIEFLQEVPMGGVLGKYPKLGTKVNAKGEWEDAPTTVYDYSKVYPVLTNAEIASLRPDLASMAGFTAYTPMQMPATGFGGDPTSAIDDDIPF